MKSLCKVRRFRGGRTRSGVQHLYCTHCYGWGEINDVVCPCCKGSGDDN